MNKLNTAFQGGRLIICRHKTPYIFKMCGWVLWFVCLMAFPFLGVFVYHTGTWAFIIFLAVLLPLFASYLYRGVTYLRPWVFVFDREHGIVTFNGKPVSLLKELKSVHVEKSFYGFRRTSGSYLRLSFLTQSGTDVEIDRSSLYGPNMTEMEQVGSVVAEYAGVPLIKPDR